MESFELVRKTSIESPLTVQDQSAYDLRHIARAYETRGDLDTSITVLRESLLLTKDRNLSLEKAWGKIALGNCLVKQGEDKVALICYEQAFEIQQETLGESVQLADTVNLIGSVFLTLGENDDALELLKKNLETMKRIASNDSERVASVLYLIGDACDAKGDFASATLYFKECLHTIKQDRSRDHPDIAKTLHRLGDVTAAQNDLNKASQYYSQALDIRRMNFDDKVVADTIYCIGLLARKRGEFDLAQKSLEEALEIRKKNGNSRGSGETLLELGNLYRLRLQPQKAMTYYEESLNVAGDDDVLLGNVQLAMGHAKLSQGDYAGALIDYKCVRFTRLASYGEDDVRTGNASRSMGIAKFLMGDSDESLDYLSEFVRVCENTGGECIKSADFFVVQLALGDIYDAAGKADQAKASWTRAKEIYDCNSDIAASLPTSIHSLSDRRLGGAKGYLSRLKEASSQGDSQGNELDDEEVVLQSMIFVDD
jgi:tetratricopeptide (TPR) repeat protein